MRQSRLRPPDKCHCHAPDHEFYEPDKSWPRTVVSEEPLGAQPVFQPENISPRHNAHGYTDKKEPGNVKIAVI